MVNILKTKLLYLSEKPVVKKISFIFVLILFLFAQTKAQDSSSHLRISLLTCGAAGDELYSTWGHTAIRITDSIKQTDIVYNFGTFDFNGPDFYMKFTRGKLDYLLSVSSLPQFMYEYQETKRSVTEQELILSETNKSAIAKNLNETLLSSARFYKYDFLYNNCTSRVRDILIKYAGLTANKKLVPAKTTFRNMLHEYLDKNAEPWSKLGIDLLLGSPIDKVVDISQSMFLPEYLLKGVDSSGDSNHPVIVKQKNILNTGEETGIVNHNWPLFIFCAFTVLVVLISLLQNKTAQNITRVFDFILLLLTGLIGCFLLFMWFGTDHKSCAANYNLLWALPTNLVAAFAIWKNPTWIKKYFSISIVIYTLTLLCWFWLPQQLNIGFIPIILLLLVRAVQLRKR